MSNVFPFSRASPVRKGNSEAALSNSAFLIVVGIMSVSVAGFVWFLPSNFQPAASLSLKWANPASGGSDEDAESANFGFCHIGGGYNCVVDGDTFYYKRVKIRIASIDAPESHPPKCEAEAALADRATRRLNELLNAGPFSLETIDRDRDRYGRSLRIPTRNGESIAAQLVDEGIARDYGAGRRSWC